MNTWYTGSSLCVAGGSLVAGGADAKLRAQDGTTVLSAAAGSGHNRQF